MKSARLQGALHVPLNASQIDYYKHLIPIWKLDPRDKKFGRIVKKKQLRYEALHTNPPTSSRQWKT